MSLDFRLFGIPIRIHIWFWLMALFLGSSPSQGSWVQLLIGVAVIFQGILMHELGHAFVGRAYGKTPHVELVALGGVTWWEQREPLAATKSVLVSFAGPAVGIAIGGAALLFSSLYPVGDPMLAFLLDWVVWVNLGWGVLNLLPMLPLDGGNITASLLDMAVPGKGRLFACYVSFAVIGALVVILGTLQYTFAIILLLFFGFSTYQIFMAERHRTGEREPATDVERAFAALERGDSKKLVHFAGKLISSAASPDERDEAFHLLAWGRLLGGEPSEAHAALQSMSGARNPDPALEGAVLVELGRPTEAMPFLERACQRGGQFAESYLARAREELEA